MDVTEKFGVIDCYGMSGAQLTDLIHPCDTVEQTGAVTLVMDRSNTSDTLSLTLNFGFTLTGVLNGPKNL